MPRWRRYRCDICRYRREVFGLRGGAGFPPVRGAVSDGNRLALHAAERAGCRYVRADILPRPARYHDFELTSLTGAHTLRSVVRFGGIAGC